MTLYVWFWIATPTVLAAFTLALLGKRKVSACRRYHALHTAS